MGTVRANSHVAHGVKDAALDGLEAVPSVRKGAGVDDGVCVLQEAVLHLAGDVDVDNVLGEVVIHRLFGHRYLPSSTR